MTRMFKFVTICIFTIDANRLFLMMRRLLLLSSVLWFLFCFGAQAKSVAIDVPLTALNSENFDEDDALAISFQKLIERFQANKQKLGFVGLKTIKRYILQYRYQKSHGNAVFRVIYDEEAVKKWLLAKKALAVTKAPQFLIWLAMMSKTSDALVGQENDIFNSTQLNIFAKHHVFFPLLDIEDRQALSFEDVWLKRQDEIVKASARYKHDGIIVLKMIPSANDTWDSTWAVLTASGWISFDILHKEQDDLIKKGLETALNKIRAWKKAYESTQLNTIYLKISGLQKYSDSQALLAKLKQLPHVADVIYDDVTGQSVLYKIQASIKPGELAILLEHDTKLTPLKTTRDDLLSYQIEHDETKILT